MATKKTENVAVLIRLPKPLLRRLDTVAKEQERSRSYVVVAQLRQSLEKKVAA